MGWIPLIMGGGAAHPQKREEGRWGEKAEGTKVRKRAVGETVIPLRPRPTKEVTSLMSLAAASKADSFFFPLHVPNADSAELQRRLHQREDPPRQRRRRGGRIRPQRRTSARNNDDFSNRNRDQMSEKCRDDSTGATASFS